MIEPVVSIKHVIKSYGQRRILDQLDLAVPKGSVFGFVGKNGAGKTTTMRLILGLDNKDSGTINVLQQSIEFGHAYPLGEIGYVPDVPTFYPYLSATEYLMLCGELAGMSKQEAQQQVASLLSKVGLTANRQKISGYSRGMKQRLAIAQGLLGDPKILICDEPTSALDPKGREEILTLLSSLRDQTTVIFSTHILADVERICDQVAMLDQGKIVCQGKIDHLKARYGRPEIRIEIAETEVDKWKHALKHTQLKNRQQDQVIYFTYEQSIDVFFEIFLSFVTTHDLQFTRYEHQDSSLEDIFLEVVK